MAEPKFKIGDRQLLCNWFNTFRMGDFYIERSLCRAKYAYKCNHTIKSDH